MARRRTGSWRAKKLSTPKTPTSSSVAAATNAFFQAIKKGNINAAGKAVSDGANIKARNEAGLTLPQFFFNFVVYGNIRMHKEMFEFLLTVPGIEVKDFLLSKDRGLSPKENVTRMDRQKLM